MEKDIARELYDFWMLLIKMQTSVWHSNNWEKYKTEVAAGRAPVNWEYRTGPRQDSCGHLPQAKLHERRLKVAYIGEWLGEPILGLCYINSTGYYESADVLFVLYPDGDFIVKQHYRGYLRMICRHTFLGTFRFQGFDHLHVVPEHGPGTSWVSIRDWQVRKPYFRTRGLSQEVLYRLVDGVIQISPDLKDVLRRWGGVYDQELHKQNLANAYAFTEKRYRLHHRKFARRKNLPDPYAVVSPRRAAKIATIQQMVQPYTPARSVLLKPLPAEQILQAQEG